MLSRYINIVTDKSYFSDETGARLSPVCHQYPEKQPNPCYVEAMRHLFIALSWGLALLGGWHGRSHLERQSVWQSSEKAEGRQEAPQKDGQAAQVDTETPTPTDTPTFTPTATVTPTATTTPDFQYVATLSSGRPVAITYTISAGEALIAVLEMILIGLVIFGLFIALVNRQ